MRIIINKRRDNENHYQQAPENDSHSHLAPENESHSQIRPLLRAILNKTP
jgi:hypothetical protein